MLVMNVERRSLNLKEGCGINMEFKKYPNIKWLGHEDVIEILHYGDDFIFIEEKVDGGNGSFWLEEDGVHFGNRNRDLTAENDVKFFTELQNKLRSHLADMESQGEKINQDYFYYMEWMAKHTISYTNAPFVIGLDIRLKHSADSGEFGLFLAREGKEREFQRLGLEVVPLVWSGKVKELKKLKIDDLVPKSKYFDGFAEGIVIKNYSRMSKMGHHQLFAKVVRDEFKENNRAVFGNVKDKESDTEKIVERFVTDARIKKQIHILVNEEGKTLSRALMQELPRRVIKDILIEEVTTIFNECTNINFKEMKQKVPKKCLRVIDEMMSL